MKEKIAQRDASFLPTAGSKFQKQTGKTIPKNVSSTSSEQKRKSQYQILCFIYYINFVNEF